MSDIFLSKQSVVPFPQLAADAKRRWSQIPESARKEIMDNVWCGNCVSGTSMQLREGTLTGRTLILHGTCKKCGGEVARVVEPAEE